MKNTILENAITLANEGKEENLEAAQTLLMEYLKLHPQNTQAWLLLIRIECNSPFDDAERIVHYVQHILSYDPLNVCALLFWSYADCYGLASSNTELYQKLCKLFVKNKKLMAMIEVAKARYLAYKDQNEYENALKKSIDYYPFMTNLQMLGDLYTKQGKIAEAKIYLQEYKNRLNLSLQSLSTEEENLDYTNIETFFDEFFAGE